MDRRRTLFVRDPEIADSIPSCMVVIKLSPHWYLKNTVTTLSSWLNNIVDNIVYKVQHNIVIIAEKHCWQYCLQSAAQYCHHGWKTLLTILFIKCSTTLLSWLNNIVDNIVYKVQHNIVIMAEQHCWQYCLQSAAQHCYDWTTLLTILFTKCSTT